MKGQSAIEYLMTYGWMLLVVAVVGGAVFSVVGDQSIESVSGFTGGDIDVENFGFSQVGSLDAVLRNTAPDSVEVSEVVLNQSGEEFRKDIDEEIGVGESFKISDLGAFESSGADSVDVEIRYSIGELSNLTVSGTVSGSLTVVGNRLGGGEVSHIHSEGKIYRVHEFGDVGAENLTVYEETEVDVLVVGGGGGASAHNSGGGGAGGLVFIPNYEVEDTINVQVGDGGEGTEGQTTTAEQGEDSEFGDLVAKGGGGGGSWSNAYADDGGAGAGGNARSSEDSYVDGRSSLQPGENDVVGEFGNDGGDAFTGGSSTRAGGGGGGAGEPGQDAGDDDAGDGGDGKRQVEIEGEIYNFADLFGTEYGEEIGDEIYFAGGGGGAPRSQNSDSVGIGGLGGSGDGHPSSTGGYDVMDGKPNTGGGAGAREDDNNRGETGGKGGSGIVLIRYPLTGLD